MSEISKMTSKSISFSEIFVSAN